MTELHRVQQSCRQGLLSDTELIGFVRIIREIKLHIEQRKLQYKSPHKSSDAHNPAEHLELSFAELEAATHVKSYSIKGSRNESAYAGRRTYVKYFVKSGFSVGREDGRAGWSWMDVEGSDCGTCHFSIGNTIGSEFGPILEHLKEIIYWHSIHFCSDEKKHLQIAIRVLS